MESKHSTSLKKILILIRHGERADQPLGKEKHKPKCGICDPELTENGVLQSFKSANILLKELSKLGIKNLDTNLVNIRSSPYMRTLQTAVHLIKGIKNSLKISNDQNQLNKIYIDYGLREQLKKKKNYEEDFLNFLSNEKFTDLDKEFKNVTFINEDKQNEFSFDKEKTIEIFKRCRNYLYVDLQQKINKKYNDAKIFILITHSGPMQLYLYNLNYRGMVESDYIYCGQFFFDISDGIKNAKFLSKAILPEFEKYRMYDFQYQDDIDELNYYLDNLANKC